jgi:hypothetical protein
MAANLYAPTRAYLQRRLKMKNILTGLALGLVLAAGTTVWAQLDQRGEQRSGNMTRACIPAIGAVLNLTTTTGADVDSGALSDKGMYQVMCDTDTYALYGASAITADGTDEWLYIGGTYHDVPTGGSEAMLHVSFMAKDAGGTCRVLECH